MRYFLVDAKEAKEKSLQHPWDEEWEINNYDYTLYLYKELSTGDFEYICSDGGEPEDQTFARDWGWVVNELNRAYKEGCIAGSGECLSYNLI